MKLVLIEKSGQIYYTISNKFFRKPSQKIQLGLQGSRLGGVASTKKGAEAFAEAGVKVSIMQKFSKRLRRRFKRAPQSRNRHLLRRKKGRRGLHSMVEDALEAEKRKDKLDHSVEGSKRKSKFKMKLGPKAKKRAGSIDEE